ncbi:arrestin domain-containing protein 17-like [Teleopsis dalmanni]|uniref:arrestin domain-containing protein 17-like n=1 Tax=Teleopsis dalmanni TaxID=139649 RepID=UPI0018CF61C3|nr:arrestin domain-containing protein 17-like [Teleopsis dalmanni]
MVVSCVIEFDNSSSDTYFADQILKGKVILNADKPKKIKAVVVKIAGFANIKWSEKTSSSSTDSKGKTTYIPSTYYTGREDYLAKSVCILGTDKGQSEVTIEPGKHIYSFDCHIPSHCPTSFVGRFGHIRYVVQVTLTRSWKSDLVFTKDFTVLTIKELNYEPNLLNQCTLLHRRQLAVGQINRHHCNWT